MNHFDAIVFDFDYTLADSSEAVVESIKYAFDNLGLCIPTDDEIKRTIGVSMGKTFEILSGKNDEVMIDGFIRFFKEKADEVALDKTYILDGVEDVLDKLKGNGLTLGIVSTKYRYRIVDVLSRDGLSDYFDIIIGGEDVAEHKPNPEGLNAAISRLGINKEKVLYVGDSITDAETARNAGVSFAAVLTGVTPETDFTEYATLTILQDLNGLLKIA